MSRGGRGGGRGGGPGGPPGSRLNHGTVPFEIAPELLAQVEELNKTDGIFPVGRAQGSCETTDGI